MANLKRRHAFRRWAPDIGENRDLPTPALWFELATGLTAEQLAAIKERLAVPVEVAEDLSEEEKIAGFKAGMHRRYLESMGEYVRVVGGPHTVDGRVLETLGDYLHIVEGQADYGQLAVKDVLGALFSFNNFSGGDELFLPRRSGSSASTAAPSVVKVEPKTESP